MLLKLGFRSPIDTSTLVQNEEPQTGKLGKMKSLSNIECMYFMQNTIGYPQVRHEKL